MGSRMHIHKYNRARRNGHTKAEFQYTLIEKKGVFFKRKPRTSEERDVPLPCALDIFCKPPRPAGSAKV